MVMLSPEQFSLGSFVEAEPLTLMLPRSDRDEAILITQAGSEKVAVYLGAHRYNACPCGDSDAWKGLLIANVSVEVDHASIFDAGREYAQPGSLVRQGTSLDVIAKMVDSYHIDRDQPVTLVSGLPAAHEHSAAGFRKWRLAIGEGYDKKELFSVDISLLEKG
jgi:hypothetical protein